MISLTCQYIFYTQLGEREPPSTEQFLKDLERYQPKSFDLSREKFSTTARQASFSIKEPREEASIFRETRTTGR